MLTEQRSGSLIFKAGSNPSTSFYSSAGKTRQCRADVVCKSGGSEINFGEKLCILGLEKVTFINLWKAFSPFMSDKNMEEGKIWPKENV